MEKKMPSMYISSHHMYINEQTHVALQRYVVCAKAMLQDKLNFQALAPLHTHTHGDMDYFPYKERGKRGLKDKNTHARSRRFGRILPGL